MPLSPDQILEIARTGDIERQGVDREAVAGAVRQFAKAGNAAAALELVGRTWRMWSSRGELDEGSAVVASALAIPKGSTVPVWESRALYSDASRCSDHTCGR
jgi:hypothetical protein